MKVAVVGAGFAGAILARKLGEGGMDVTVIEERSHVAGNCHTERDPETGVMIHRYGPHIFHTDNQEVWDYVNWFAPMRPFVNRVKAVTYAGVYSLPVNLHTINQFFGKAFSPKDAEEFIADRGDKTIGEPENFEQQALKFLGAMLYSNFFYGYTKKQWGVEPTELPASILKRLPVRFNYNDNYYASKYQGIPVVGYTALIERILNNDKITVRLGEKFSADTPRLYDHVFYSGPIDAFFNHRLGRLGYRSLTFERIDAVGDYQGNAVINYCDPSVPWTRIAEHKHFTPWETHEKTVAFKEFSKLAEPGDIPYYPLRLAADKALLAQYVEAAEALDGVTFLGRLGTYRYLDMHQVVAESLALARAVLATPHPDWPRINLQG